MSGVGRNDPCPCGSGEKYKRCCERAALSARREGERVSEILGVALEDLHAGRFHEAAIGYRQVLELRPNHPDALHFLGVIAHREGKADLAIKLMERAIGEKPSAVCCCSLGNVFLDRRELERAVASYREAVRLEPGYAEARNNLGAALNALGRRDEAAECFREAVTRKPELAEAQKNLGADLLSRGNHQDAAVRFQKAVLLNPEFAEAHRGLGAALHATGRLGDAAASYAKAAALRPDCAEIANDLAFTLAAIGRLDEAVASYARAIEIKPDYAEAHCDLGVVYKRQRRFDEAIQCYARAIALKPELAESYNNLGVALNAVGKTEDAYACFERAIAKKRGFVDAYSNLVSIHGFAHDLAPESQLTLASGWEKMALTESERTEAAARRSQFSSRRGQKLKLGIVSAELWRHAVAYFLEPVLKELDRRRFEVTLYPTFVWADDRAARMRELADKWKPLVGISDAKAAEQIRADQIDVLIDTSSHTSGGRLGIFAHRAAPVQCHYIGHCCTSGLTEMDWFLADGDLLPPGCDAHFRERIWRLPRVWLAYEGDTSLAQSRWRAGEGGVVWLGSFNNFEKIRQDTCRLWAKVMNALPQSKLLLKDGRAAAGSVQRRIQEEFAAHGIGSERIVFAGRTPDWSAHMALYDRLDIALDPVPLNSGTTAFDALWMGVPLVTLEGDWMGGRMGSSVLRALGKPEWVAQSEEEYAAIAAGLAGDVEGRKEMRARQRAEMASGPLCDAKGLARALEDAFEAMLRDWVLGSERKIRRSA